MLSIIVLLYTNQFMRKKSKDMNVYRLQCLDNLAISFRAKFLNCVQLMQNMTGSETKFPGVFFTNSFLDKNYY